MNRNKSKSKVNMIGLKSTKPMNRSVAVIRNVTLVNAILASAVPAFLNRGYHQKTIKKMMSKMLQHMKDKTNQLRKLRASMLIKIRSRWFFNLHQV